MDESLLPLVEGFIGKSYTSQAAAARKKRQRLLRILLSSRKLPDQGWDDLTIRGLLSDLAQMDSNNFVGNVGAGEREGRVYNALVRDRHFQLAHGIGRSGDIAAIQPKAAGSALLMSLTRVLALEAMRTAGTPEAKSCLVLPVATGMAHVLTFLTLKLQRPGAKYVLWPRIDQKTCLKAMVTAGLIPVVIDNTLEGDEVRTDLAAIEAQLKKLGSDNVLAIMTTSSCFAPRVPDRVVEVAKIAKAAGVPHVINNAYGVQTSNAMKLITTAKRRGRVDAFICSTDKNFMVPVGGSIITGFDVKFIDEIAKTYPGRAAMTPLCDIFITLLSLGKNGWVNLLSQREQLLPYFKATLAKVAAKHGERLLETPNNLISVGVTLGSFIRKPVAQAASEEDGVEVAAAAVPDRKSSQSNLSFIGSMMFSRLISGARTVPQHVEKTIVGYSFHGYGASHAGFPHPYATFACAIGMTKADVDVMATRFDKTLKDARKKLAKQVKQLAVMSPCMQQKQQKTPLVTPSLTTQSINQPQR